jgi:hypothetical protein
MKNIKTMIFKRNKRKLKIHMQQHDYRNNIKSK